MNSFWHGLYDRAKDRRYGTLFFLSLCAFPLALVFIVVWLVTVSWRALPRRSERIKYYRLSSDELAKARSKLLKQRNRTSV